MDSKNSRRTTAANSGRSRPRPTRGIDAAADVRADYDALLPDRLRADGVVAGSRADTPAQQWIGNSTATTTTSL